MPNPFIATRVYLKPLLPAQPLRGMRIDDVLRRAKRDLLRRIKRKLLQETFSDAAKKALARAVKVELMPSSLRVTAKHPAFGPLLRGQKHEQMAWLTKARAPIPIITETGKLIFRTATAKSMADGKWVHPGRRPSTFLDKAKKEAREFLKAKFQKELREQLRRSWRQR